MSFASFMPDTTTRTRRGMSRQPGTSLCPCYLWVRLPLTSSECSPSAHDCAGNDMSSIVLASFVSTLPTGILSSSSTVSSKNSRNISRDPPGIKPQTQCYVSRLNLSRESRVSRIRGPCCFVPNGHHFLEAQCDNIIHLDRTLKFIAVWNNSEGYEILNEYTGGVSVGVAR